MLLKQLDRLWIDPVTSTIRLKGATSGFSSRKSFLYFHLCFPVALIFPIIAPTSYICSILSTLQLYGNVNVIYLIAAVLFKPCSTLVACLRLPSLVKTCDWYVVGNKVVFELLSDIWPSFKVVLCLQDSSSLGEHLQAPPSNFPPVFRVLP